MADLTHGAVKEIRVAGAEVVEQPVLQVSSGGSGRCADVQVLMRIAHLRPSLLSFFPVRMGLKLVLYISKSGYPVLWNAK
jgi:hypothetical protein